LHLGVQDQSQRLSVLKHWRAKKELEAKYPYTQRRRGRTCPACSTAPTSATGKNGTGCHRLLTAATACSRWNGDIHMTPSLPASRLHQSKPEMPAGTANAMADGHETRVGDIPIEHVDKHCNCWVCSEAKCPCRLQHDFQLVPHNLEVSHLAEAYHNPAGIQDFQQGYKVMLVTAENAFVNKSRRWYFKTGPTWWNATTAQLLTDDELPYRGPSSCMHAPARLPCISARFQVSPSFHSVECIPIQHALMWPQPQPSFSPMQCQQPRVPHRHPLTKPSYPPTAPRPLVPAGSCTPAHGHNSAHVPRV